MFAVATGLLGGLAADAAFGDPHRGHPVAVFGRIALRLERATYRDERAAGVVHVTPLVGGAALVGVLADAVARRRLGPGIGTALITTVTTWAALGGQSLVDEGRTMSRLLRDPDPAAARERAPRLVGRDPSGLGHDELGRAVVESLAENTADAVVGPLVWGAIAGPAGVLAYRAANTLDAMVGHRSARYRRFGWAAARLDDVLTWPAARIGAALTVLLAPLVGGSPTRTLRAVARDGGAHPSPNSGQLEAAFAGALGVRLGGRNVYAGRVEDRPIMGAGPLPGPDEVERAARLCRLVGTASGLLSAAVTVIAPRSSVRRAALMLGLAAPVAVAGRVGTAP